ncbi:MAG TPA: VanZ family protein [Polyangiaceae bacterium]|nr:VanZ family protein [Polyangiaceae bacterium]
MLYVLAIFVVGSLPGAPPVARDVSDKLQHAVGFGLLAGLWCRALGRLRPQASVGRIALGGFLVSVGVGGVLELWQALLSYRTCEFLDWVADGAGAALAVAVYAVAHQLFGARARAAE